MFDNLEQLLKLTKLVEAEGTKVDEEEDLPATIFTYDEKGNPEGALTTKHGAKDDADDEDEKDEKSNSKKSEKKSPKKDEKDDEDDDEKDESDDDSDDDDNDSESEKPEDGKPYGSSGNATVKGKDAGPLFEPDDAAFEDYTGFDDFGMAPNEGKVDEEGIGLPNIRKEMKFSLTDAIERGMGREFARKIKFEAANPLFVSNAPFKLGDVVSAEGNPMLYVVKNTDGTMITAAKPTDNTAEHCHCKDGCWPEYTFAQDEITTMPNATMNDLGDITAFNDRFRGFDGTVEDSSPMERAQEYAKQQTIEDISQDLDEILGQYKFAANGGDKDFTYTACSPKVVFRRPDGSVTTEQQMGGYKIKWGD